MVQGPSPEYTCITNVQPSAPLTVVLPLGSPSRLIIPCGQSQQGSNVSPVATTDQKPLSGTDRPAMNRGGAALPALRSGSRPSTPAPVA